MKRIALVEDDSDIAYTIRLNLEREGYTVTHFANGNDAMAALQRGGFEFVILDLNLPDLDGLTICRELRRDPATAAIPILMLTARGSSAIASPDSSSAPTITSPSRSACASSSPASERSGGAPASRRPIAASIRIPN